MTTYIGTGNLGTTDGSLEDCTFGHPVNIEIDRTGNTYVASKSKENGWNSYQNNQKSPIGSYVFQLNYTIY